ncbi:MAG: endonuclease domain-containing protein [Dehalococcoidales bacterium]|jgi:very-short-patch-repair endonuclease
MKQQANRWRTYPDLWEKLKPIAHEKRNEPTGAEKELWQHLRMHRLHGLSFRRQHCAGQFIVDFYCSKAKLVIEVDGEIHQYQAEEDKIRQEYLESLGLKVLRFTNNAVLNNIEEVIRVIENYLP